MNIQRQGPMATIGLLGLNIAVFVILELILPMDRSAQIFADGVLFWPAVCQGEQYYRVLTSMFLHVDSMHLMNNMLILFLVGERLEERVGRIRLLTIYFVSGILAGLTSMGYNILQERITSSAGASGAVFGVVGALVWVLIKHRGKLQGLTGRKMLIFAVLSLYAGFADRQTDNAAHLGGFLAGVLMTMLLYHPGKVEEQAVETADCEEI